MGGFYGTGSERGRSSGAESITVNSQVEFRDPERKIIIVSFKATYFDNNSIKITFIENQGLVERKKLLKKIKREFGGYAITFTN